MDSNSNKIQRMLEPGLKMYLFVLVAFAAAAVFFNRVLAMVEGGIILVLLVYSIISTRRRRKAFREFVESVTYNTESATSNTLIHFPLPMAVFRLNDSSVVWGNQLFWGDVRPERTGV